MIILKVPNADTELAKELGAKFFYQTKQWYAPTGKERKLIARFGDETAKKKAKNIVEMLTLDLLRGRYCPPSDAFLDGQVMYPGYAFISDKDIAQSYIS